MPRSDASGRPRRASGSRTPRSGSPDSKSPGHGSRSTAKGAKGVTGTRGSRGTKGSRGAKGSSPRRPRAGRLDRFAGSAWALLPTFILALVIRLIHLDQMNGYGDFRAPILDEAWSWDLATHFVAGTAGALRPFDADPGAAFVVSYLVRIVGSRPDLVLAGLAVLGSAASVMIQMLGVRVVGGAGGLFCGLLAAFHRPAIHHGAHLVDAAFVPFVAALALLLIVIQAESKRPGTESISGFFGGAVAASLALFQAPLIVVAPVLLVVLIFDRKMKLPQKLRRGLSFTGGALGVLALLTLVGRPAGPDPVLSRNQVVPPNFGREFHIANRDGNRAGDRLPPHWAPADPAGLAAAYREEGARVSAPEEAPAIPATTAAAIDRAWFDRTGLEAAGNPWGFLSGWAWRAWRLLNAHEAPGPYDMAWESGRSWILRLPFPGWAILFPLALAGIMAARGASKDPALTVLVAWACVVMLAAWPFAVTSRVRMALEPALIILAVRGVMRLAGLIRKRDMPALSRTALVVAVAAILVRLPAGGTGPAPFHRFMASEYATRGATRAAADHREEAERRVRGVGKLGR